MTFQQDISSKHLNVYPIVKIVFNDGSIQYISTRKGDFVEVISEISDPPLGTCSYQIGEEFDVLHTTTEGVEEEWCLHQTGGAGNPSWVQAEIGESITYHFKPILLNIPAISESIDVETKKYRISSVTLNISDYEYDGKRFSDSLTDLLGNSIINAEIYIYYVSQSMQTFADFQLVGHFIVRKFTQNDKQVNLICEDRSQAELHKDLPSISLGDGEEIPDKYKGKPIPMVYGLVNKSPCVIGNLSNEGEITIHTDIVESATTLNSVDNPLLVFNNDRYLEVIQNHDHILHWGYSNPRQYELDGNRIVVTLKLSADVEDVIESPISEDFFGAVLKESYRSLKLYTFHDDYVLPSTYSHYFWFTATDVGETVPIYFIFEAFGGAGNPDFQTWEYRIQYIFEALDMVEKNFYQGGTDQDELMPNITFDFNYDVAISDVIGTIILDSYPNYQNLHTQTDNDIALTNQEFTKEIGWNNVNSQTFRLSPHTSGENSANGNFNLNSIQRTSYHLSDKFRSSKFFADVTGRIGANPSPFAIIQNILTEELGFPTGAENFYSESFEAGEWSLSFAIDKKINSKKLIEEILQSTTYWGFFKDDKFNLISSPRLPLPGLHPSIVRLIDANDVIDYKFDRTPIEKVVTRVIVKYHYDYGLKDYTKETLPWVASMPAGNPLVQISDSLYTNKYYGLVDEFGNDKHQDLIFESKYIRTETSANQLAEYLLRQNCNQHNIFTIKLPLSYINLKLMQVVWFNKLIQGQKAFGENYSQAGNVVKRNGQCIFYSFHIVQIKKTLEYVEVKLFQLHDLLYAGAENTLPGCTDPNALNYDPDAVLNDGSCEYLPVPGFCAFNVPDGDDSPHNIQSADADGNQYTQQSCSIDGGVFDESHGALEQLYGCMDSEASEGYDPSAQLSNNNFSCIYTTFLGDFQFTQDLENQFTNLSLAEFYSLTITISWDQPENAAFGLDSPSYQLQIYDNPQLLGEIIGGYSNLTSEEATIYGYQLLSTAEAGETYAFFAKVTCFNNNTEPTFVICGASGAGFFPFTIGMEEDEDDGGTDDPVIPFELLSPTTLFNLTANVLDTTPSLDIYPFDQYGFTFEMKVSTDEFTFNEEESWVLARVHFWSAYFQTEGYSGNHYTITYMVKLRLLETSQDGEDYRIKFIADEIKQVGAFFWSDAPLNNDWGITTTELGFDEDFIEDSWDPVIAIDGDPLLTNIVDYVNLNWEDPPSLVSPNGNQVGPHPLEIMIFGYKLMINDIEHKLISGTPTAAYRATVGENYNPFDEGYYLYNYDVFGQMQDQVFPENVITYDITGDGDITLIDLSTLVAFWDGVEEEYPEAAGNLYYPIDINDPDILNISVPNDASITNIITLLDLNGQVPAGQFCKQDMLDVYDIIMNMTL